MTHKERIETAWRFQEPDRVPIELEGQQRILNLPFAAHLRDLIREHADNFMGAPGADFGFMGLPTQYTETVIEDKPGEYKRIERQHKTSAGTFTAITHHPVTSTDYHWEKRFIGTVQELQQLATAPRQPARWDRAAYIKAVEDIGDRGLPFMALFHPLGTLVRNATTEEVYMWLRDEPKLVHQFLISTNRQVIATVESMKAPPGNSLTFMSWAHEMLIPPWMGHDLFDEFVFPYDKAVYAAIHKGGGRFRAHSHGRCMDFLRTFSDMGVDAVEPLEPAPYANVELAEAKRQVGKCMLLSGNIPDQAFPMMSPDEVRRAVRDAIRAAAPGGGFTLRTTGGDGGTSMEMPEPALKHVIANGVAYMEAALEYGQYPIRMR